MEIHRQGDVLFIGTDIDINIGSKIQPQEIVVKGATGHDHKAYNGSFYPKTSNKSPLIIGFLIANKDCKIKHPDHETLILSPMVYEVRRQREIWNGQERIIRD